MTHFVLGPEGYLERPDASDALVHPTRTDHQVLVSIAQLLEEQLAEIKHLRAAVGAAAESRSSASVKTSARGYDCDIKSYADGLLDTAIDEAVAGYARAQIELAALQANGWRETANSTRAERVAGEA